MDDVKPETLQQLMERRLLELGRRRGRNEKLSLREVWQTLPIDPDGKRPISYELVRRVQAEGHTNISDRAADAIATMLDVAVSDVLTAAGQRPRLGRFELPRRADRLTDSERGVVVSVVDAILDAGAADRSNVEQSQARKAPVARSLQEVERRLRANMTAAKTPAERDRYAALLADLEEASRSTPVEASSDTA